MLTKILFRDTSYELWEFLTIYIPTEETRIIIGEMLNKSHEDPRIGFDGRLLNFWCDGKDFTIGSYQFYFRREINPYFIEAKKKLGIDL